VEEITRLSNYDYTTSIFPSIIGSIKKSNQVFFPNINKFAFPISVRLDHGPKLVEKKNCLDNGFSNNHNFLIKNASVPTSPYKAYDI